MKVAEKNASLKILNFVASKLASCPLRSQSLEESSLQISSPPPLMVESHHPKLDI